MKKLILLVVDSLHPAVLDRLLAEGNVPALRFLAEHGQVRNDVVSSFPTMTPVALSSIATGCWPDRHAVPGFIWYDAVRRRIIDYGGTWQSVVTLGPEQVVSNLLHRLNYEHLSPDVATVYERLEQGKYSAGNINFFMHRGLHPYIAKVPLSVVLATGFRLYREQMFGPQFLALGDFVHPQFRWQDFLFGFPRGILHRYGFNDAFSAQMAIKLIHEQRQPDFLLVYFPDNDKYSHTYGPLRTGSSLERIDGLLQRLLSAWGSWERALEDNVFVVTGDHSQTTIGLGSEYQIDLERALRYFKRLRPTEAADGSHEIAICPNERSAFVYILKDEAVLLPEIVEILARDGRNTHIAWKDGENRYAVVQGGTEKRLTFACGGECRDVYGQSWDFEGALAVVDAAADETGVIRYGRYPDALERLRSALEARPGVRVVLSATPGCEYFAENAPIHPGGGSHGSLEWEDSVVPMIIAGTAKPFTQGRITGIYDFVLEHFSAG